MATLTITKSYVENEVLSASDIDNIINSVEAFVNTTGLNDDNINSESITASSKIKTASITTSKIADSAVTTAALGTDSILTPKINNSAVTANKIADNTLLKSKFYSQAPLAGPGTTIMFHTFNGALSIPRGWMKCNGDQINESNYDAIHGAGAFESDGILSGDLFAKFLPDMNNKYPVGTEDTTETGINAIATVGNSANIADMSHSSHSVANHTHNINFVNNVIIALQFFNRIWFYRFTSSDNGSTFSFSGISSQSHSTELSSVDIQPDSTKFIYLMKVI